MPSPKIFKIKMKNNMAYAINDKAIDLAALKGKTRKHAIGLFRHEGKVIDILETDDGLYRFINSLMTKLAADRISWRGFPEFESATVELMISPTYLPPDKLRSTYHKQALAADLAACLFQMNQNWPSRMYDMNPRREYRRSDAFNEAKWKILDLLIEARWTKV